MRMWLFPIVGLVLLLPMLVQAAERYTCPMHPHYIADAMGTCPICGMDLVPVAAPQSTQPEHKAGEQDSGGTEERAPVTIAPETIQNMGVRTEAAHKTSFGKAFRSYGVVATNERLQKTIYSRVEGWITELGVSAVGDRIAEGGLTYIIHSPDLVLAQRDLLMLKDRGLSTDLSKLLVHYELEKSLIENLRKSGKVLQDVPYYSPYTGTVSALNVRPGSYVTLDTPLMVVEDYSSVWVEVSIAEQDLRYLSQDSLAHVRFPHLGNLEREAQIDYLYPTIDNATRTGKVRLVLENPDRQFRPGAYVDVVFETAVESRLSVPSEAILSSSRGDYVVMALGQGRFQPRQVHTGIHDHERTEILHGLQEGELVVVSSQFLIDSESSLQDAFRKMEKPAGDTHAGH